jgi:aspartyl-tRNA synthetase
MDRTLTKDTINKVGETVTLKGWVQTRRDHGKIVFIDLRDRWGIVQVVATSQIAGNVGPESVVEIIGEVKARPEKLVNPKIETGSIELEAEEVKVLSKAETLPFPIDTEGHDIDEEIRMKYRYLDLRRPRMRQNIELRNKVISSMRKYFQDKDFWEIETPIITKATPEGARDFLVPSRMHPGEFYALPQSPQQYKQLSMVAGIERYFQVARCFRDEDPRADRAYGEFTQLDVEISFTSQEEIRNLIETLYIEIVKEIFPEKHIQQIPFPVLTYKEAMEKYSNDKPDLRKDKNDPNELAFCWVVDFPLFEWKEKENRWDATHHPFTAPKKEFITDIIKANPKDRDEKVFQEAMADQYDFVLNGFEVGGGSIRITDPELQTKIFEILGHTKEQIQEKFGHLIKAFTFGVPPHGGIAPGIDRFIMVVRNEPSVREAMAFPAGASGHISVMEAPSDVEPEQLEELGISLINNSSIPAFEKITKLLDKEKINYKVIEHKEVTTSEEAAEVRGTKLEQGAKAMVMIGDGKPLMIVLPANRKINSGVFKKANKIKEMHSATPEEVERLTGSKVGGVPPFGNLFKLTLYVDKNLGDNDEIAFNAGERTKSIIMKYKDYESLVKPIIGEYSVLPE